MRIVELDGVAYKLPQSWADIPPAKLPKLIQLVYLVPESGRLYHQLLQLVLDISPGRWKKLHQKHFSSRLPENIRTKNAQVLHELIRMLSWLWETPLDRAPAAGLEINNQTWLLPEQGFQTVSFGELTDLYIHLQAYINQEVEGEERLNYLVATACRPPRPARELRDPNWNGDKRERYNEFITRERVRLVATLPFTDKLPILLYVASSIQAILGQYSLFDTGSDKGSAEAYSGQGFIKNQHLLAQKAVFGNLKETQQANAHEVLLFLEEHRQDLQAEIDRQRQANQE